MRLREWIRLSGTSVQSFAHALNVQRAMIYRYYTGTIPRAQTMHRIENLTNGAVTPADFYASAWEVASEKRSEVTPMAGHAV